MTLYAAPSAWPEARLGIAVGRRYGTAVHRNRVKRLIREAFRRIRFQLPQGGDWIVIPRPGIQPDVATFQKSILRLAHQLEPSLQRISIRKD